MHFDIARDILATPNTKGSHPACFRARNLIWAEHGDEVEQWNAFAAEAGWGEITVRSEDHPDGEQDFFYTYRGRETECPFEGDRDDNLRSVHHIATIVRADAELWGCNDLVGNSEWAFLALRPGQSAALEAEFGAETLARRLTRVEGTFEEFFDHCFRDENLRIYGDDQETHGQDGSSGAGPAIPIAPAGPASAEAPGLPSFPERAGEFAATHWLPIVFISFMLAVLLFGK